MDRIFPFYITRWYGIPWVVTLHAAIAGAYAFGITVGVLLAFRALG